jgi:hypothetical protein
MTDDGRQMTERITSFRDLRLYQAAFELQQEIGRMLGTMINKPSSFCRQYSK